jgi:molecular chaperone GrpE
VGDSEQTLKQRQTAGSPDGEPAGADSMRPTGRPPARNAAAERERGPAASASEQGEALHMDAHAGADEAALEGDVDELMTVAAQRDEYLALAQRTQADFENYRKRVARESSVAAAKGVAKVVKELLPALDSLDRALEGAAQDDPLLDGVRLVRSELLAALERVGVECFSPLGERFDPAEHEAMAQRQSAGAESGSVLEVYQAGYRMGDHILRPARVVVAA